ncbi:MAG TPA: hypothetical protein DER01_19035 [Phycisphaerales bacterium]|nr:hypothetical protein [Phycisphaerales bacterium]|tara:strand:+ start:57637 stop:58239 length:603 start_codon:yes stop_codon:yes gene_type:complete
MIRNSLLLSAMAFALLLNGLAIAQDSPVEESADKPTVSEPVKADNDAADVVDQMMKKMKQQQPVVEPTERPSASATEKRPALSPSPKIDLDPKILGIAPGMPKPKLRREGEFVVNRQGRLLRSNDGQHMVFAYKSDSKLQPEPPMIVVPCQLLQNMEEMMLERGDQITFSITGQILSYHGTNYILPTMMKPAIDMGNLGN